MLGWIVGIAAVTAITILTLDILGNDAIFEEELEEETGTAGPCPYDSIEKLSCDTEVRFTDLDRKRSLLAAGEIRELLGRDPVEGLRRMEGKERIDAAKELHKRLCTRFSLDLGLEMGRSEECIYGYFSKREKKIWLDYRFLLSDHPEYIYGYLDTVIHEFRHAMQHTFIEDKDYNNSEDGYRRRMAACLHPSVYMSFTENPELYHKQLCERDAREYASMVMELVKGDES